MRIQAICFDLDGPLVYLTGNVMQYLTGNVMQYQQEILRRLGFRFDLDQVNTAFNAVQRWWKDRFLVGQLRTQDSWVEFDVKLLETLGVEEELIPYAEQVKTHWDNLSESGYEQLYPEVDEVLRALRALGVKMAVTSHRQHHMSIKCLQVHGIHEYFTCIVSPELAQALRGKLNPKFWHYALTQLNVHPSETLYIEDEEEWISTAQALDLQPLLIDRTNRDREHHDSNLPIIHSLTALFPHLQ